MKTPMQEFIEVLKIHRDTAFEKEKMCEAKAKSYYEGRAKAFEDAISFAEEHLEKEKEVIVDAHIDGQCDETEGYPIEIARDYYNETFNINEK